MRQRKMAGAASADTPLLTGWRRNRRDETDDAIAEAQTRGFLNAGQAMLLQMFAILHPAKLRQMLEVALEANGQKGDKPTLEELIAAIMTIIAFIQAFFNTPA